MPEATLADLDRGLHAVGRLVAGVGPDQWSSPTPCSEWDVRRLVEHLIGMNRVFTALLAGQVPPRRPAAGEVETDPVAAYGASAAALRRAFAEPGVLPRQYDGPMGSATGEDRLHIRMYDLLAHGWDLARATDQADDLPDDLASQSLTFARMQVTEQSRSGRFEPATSVPDDAPAIEQLVAFLGRSVHPAPQPAAPPAR